MTQSAVTGTGTAADPYRLVTEVQLGGSGLRLGETDTYIVGEEAYRTTVQLLNDTSSTVSATIYRAGEVCLVRTAGH